jgi:ATP-binding cassette subfamily F protein 3
VVVSHDRHLIRSTTDDLYLVHDGKVEPFDGDLEDYQQWLSDSQNRSPRAATRQKRAATARRRAKTRSVGKRSCAARPNRCAKRSPVWKKRWKLNAQLASAEEKLGDSELYDASRKELTECLQQQASAKSGLEECEMAWLEAQEQLERCFRKANRRVIILPAPTMARAEVFLPALAVWPSVTSMVCCGVTWRHWPQDHILANSCAPCAV